MKTLHERLTAVRDSPIEAMHEVAEILDEHGDKERQLIEAFGEWEKRLLAWDKERGATSLRSYPTAVTIRAIIEKVYGGGG